MSLTCPECDSTLKLAQAVAAGTKVKCPRCSAVFAARPEEGLRCGEARRRPAAELDDEPAATPRRRSRDDDFDDPDRGRPRRKDARSARATDDEFDDDFDDAPFRGRKPRKAGSSKGLIIGLAIGGGVAVVAVIGIVLFLVLGGSAAGTQKRIVGEWESNGPAPVRWTFSADGKFTEGFGGIRSEGKYRVVSAGTLEIERHNPFADMVKDFGKMAGQFKVKGMPGMPDMNIDIKMPDFGALNKQHLSVSVSDHELTVQDGFAGALKFKRVR